jgi:hypothetical protein
MKGETEKEVKPVEMNLLDLLLRDMRINQEIFKTFRGNFTALKGYLMGIGNPTVRETFRLHIQDSERVLASLVNQTDLIVRSLEKAKNKWDQQQPKPVTPTPASPADVAAEPKSSLPSPESSSASDVGVLEGSQPQQA